MRLGNNAKFDLLLYQVVVHGFFPYYFFNDAGI
jgi:hypothetical protein